MLPQKHPPGDRQTENNRITLERLRELGWTEGRNLVLENRFVGPDRERLTAAVKEMVDLGVDLILTGGGAETPQIAMSATKTIPIVFAIADDPVRLGLVKSLSRPAGNITGVSSMNAELDAKRLELLKEIVPNLRRVGVMWSPVDPSGAAVMSAAEGAARSLNLRLEPLAILRAEDLAAAFADAKKRAVEAVAILGTPILFSSPYFPVTYILVLGKGFPIIDDEDSFSILLYVAHTVVSLGP